MNLDVVRRNLSKPSVVFTDVNGQTLKLGDIVSCAMDNILCHAVAVEFVDDKKIRAVPIEKHSHFRTDYTGSGILYLVNDCFMITTDYFKMTNPAFYEKAQERYADYRGAVNKGRPMTKSIMFITNVKKDGDNINYTVDCTFKFKGVGFPALRAALIKGLKQTVTDAENVYILTKKHGVVSVKEFLENEKLQKDIEWFTENAQWRWHYYKKAVFNLKTKLHSAEKEYFGKTNNIVNEKNYLEQVWPPSVWVSFKRQNIFPSSTAEYLEMINGLDYHTLEKPGQGPNVADIEKIEKFLSKF